jgi:hypothetical protein
MTQLLLIDTPKELAYRLALNARWLTLVKETLPAMAKEHRWPISRDHCFMRVCLDTALGSPWHAVVKRPAIKHLSDHQIKSAICVAQSVVNSPELLYLLNENSLRSRKLSKA